MLLLQLTDKTGLCLGAVTAGMLMPRGQGTTIGIKRTPGRDGSQWGRVTGSTGLRKKQHCRLGAPLADEAGVDFAALYGATEAAPFQNKIKTRVFRKLPRTQLMSVSLGPHHQGLGAPRSCFFAAPESNSGDRIDSNRD